MRILVTGVAGFIGFHLAQALLERGDQVIGVDSLNDYYDPDLKRARLAHLAQYPGFRFSQIDLADDGALESVADPQTVDVIVHLAAQAGVRYSIENPRAYTRSNINGHLNVLEFARNANNLKHLVYASSSSVYGDRTDGPFSETDITRSPASLYAATKLGGEMLAESYARLYGIPQTGLRFFTVYGPWGRPDMAYWIFTEKILNGEPIDIFAGGDMSRDFTYIDDIISGIVGAMDTVPSGGVPHTIYNLGNSSPTALMDLVQTIEKATGVAAKKNFLPKQMGDVSATFADVRKAEKAFGYKPQTQISEGIPQFVDWYRNYKQI